MSRADIKNNIVFYRSYVVINNIYLNGIRIIYILRSKVSYQIESLMMLLFEGSLFILS